jgi:CRISPR-associated exonuclease Cas4
MMRVAVPDGALFYGKIRRRHDVAFSPELRRAVEETVTGVRSLLETGITPPAVFEKKCSQCSLLEICLPRSLGRKRDVKRYLSSALEELED